MATKRAHIIDLISDGGFMVCLTDDEVDFALEDNAFRRFRIQLYGPSERKNAGKDPVVGHQIRAHTADVVVEMVDGFQLITLETSKILTAQKIATDSLAMGPSQPYHHLTNQQATDVADLTHLLSAEKHLGPLSPAPELYAASEQKYSPGLCSEIRVEPSSPQHEEVAVVPALADVSKSSDHADMQRQATLPIPEEAIDFKLTEYKPFNPEPWARAIAEHQARTSKNFQAIAQTLDSINAELQFILSEFLIRQYEKTAETLKLDHELITQQEQEQERMLAQMMSFMNAMRDAFQIFDQPGK
ncbi:hypothetical protein BX616_009949 [Lobosporangium transversale]|nr:hypothetical protein BX616_009949 [Lobosporangium transversale]